MTYSYDAGNRLTSVVSPYSETSSYTYDAANRVTQLTAGNNALTTTAYDTADRPTSVWHKQSAGAGGATLGRYQYTYDKVSGAITSGLGGLVGGAAAGKLPVQFTRKQQIKEATTKK